MRGILKYDRIKMINSDFNHKCIYKSPVGSSLPGIVLKFKSHKKNIKNSFEV